MDRKSRRPRFLVNPKSGLTVTIPQSPSKTHRLATIGTGGFGFYCGYKESRLIKMTEIDAVLNIADNRIQVHGRIEYFKFLPQLKNDVYFVGVRFLAKESHSEDNIRKVMESALHRGELAWPQS